MSPEKKTFSLEKQKLPLGFDFSLFSEEDDLSLVSSLMQSYFSELGLQIDNQDLDHDLASLAQAYSKGGFILLNCGKIPVGCLGIREIGQKKAELKRMYLSPEHRNSGLGRLLLNSGIQLAKEKGFSRLFLDTRRDLKSANALYEEFGFQDTDNYNQNPRAERFMVLEL